VSSFSELALRQTKEIELLLANFDLTETEKNVFHYSRQQSYIYVGHHFYGGFLPNGKMAISLAIFDE
jgi:hypothetical protein